MERKTLYEFGPFLLDPRKRVLLRGENAVPLTPKAVDTLLVLVENREKVMPKDELMKAVWPDSFVEESNLSQNIFMLRRALGDSAHERRFIATVPGRGYQFVEEVREVDNGSSSEDLVFERRSRSRVVIEQIKGRRVSPRLIIALVVVVAGAVAGGFYFRKAGGAGSSSSASAVPPIPIRRSVAVLGLRNLSGRPEQAWLGTAIAEMLRTELAAGGKLRMVPGEDIARSKIELQLADTDSLGKSSLAGLGINLGTDLIVLGSYTAVAEQREVRLRLDLRLQDTKTGETVAQEAFSGNEAELFELVSSVGERLREQLGAGTISPQQATEVRASLPSNAKAAKLYSEGLARLRVFDGLSARDSFQKSIAIEPNFPLAHSELARAWSLLGFESKFKDESQKAFALSGNLSRPDRMWIEATYREGNHEWANAVEIYKTLYDFFPDNLDYGLRLASDLVENGKPKEARAVTDNLRRLPGPSGKDPRIDLAAVRTYVETGDSEKRAEGLTESSVREARARGERLLLAEALRGQAALYLRTGDMDKAISAADQARSIYHETGDKFSEAAVLAQAGTAYWYKWDWPKSVDIYRQCLAVNREVGNPTGQGKALNYVASVLAEQSDLDGAREAVQAALKLFRDQSDQRDEAGSLGILAWVESAAGNLAKARQIYQKQLEIFRKVQDRESVANTLEQFGLVVATQGQLEQAEKMELDAITEATSVGDKVNQVLARKSLAMIVIWRGDFDTARKRLDEADTLAKDTGSNGAELEIAFWRASISFGERNFPSAESLLRRVVEEFRQAHDNPGLLESSAFLVTTLIYEQKIGDAQKQLEAIHEVTAKANYFEELLEVRIAEDRLKAATGKAQEATHDLAIAAAAAKSKGYPLLALEARLAIGEIEMQSGALSAGRAHLVGVEKDAKKSGFNFVARQATAARG